MAVLTLEQAINDGNIEALHKLVDQKVDVNEKYSNGSTPLHAAVIRCKIDEIKLLLDAGARTSLNEQDQDGNTPLHVAAYHRYDKEVLKLLIDAGASINLQNKHGQIPIHLVIQRNDFNLTKLFLDAGSEESINEQGSDGNTLLHWAAYYRGVKEDVVQLLLDFGAGKSMSIKNKWGNTPLHWAVIYSYNKNIFEYFLQHEAEAVVNEINNEGQTPLHLAISKGKKDFIELLLRHGAKSSVNVKDRYGKTPLFELITNQKNTISEELKTEIMRILISAEADVNIPKNDNITPIQFIIGSSSCNGDQLKMLIEAGAEVNSEDPETGRTVLHLAVQKNDIDLVDYLLSFGADTNIRDNNGLTPLHLAVHCNEGESHLNVIQKLLKTFSEPKYGGEHKNRHFELDLEYQTRIISLLSDQVLSNNQEMIEKEKVKADEWAKLVKNVEEMKKCTDSNINQDKAVESEKLEKLKKKIEKISVDADSRVSQLKEELSEEKQDRKLERGKIEELMKTKVEEIRKNCNRKIRDLIVLFLALIVLIVSFFFMYESSIYFFTQ